MTLRNRNKEKSSIPISSLEVTSDNTTKLMIDNAIGDDQKDKANTSSGDQGSIEDGVSRSPLNSSSTEGDETLTRKKLPRVILRLGKPPDVSV